MSEDVNESRGAAVFPVLLAQEDIRTKKMRRLDVLSDVRAGGLRGECRKVAALLESGFNRIAQGIAWD